LRIQQHKKCGRRKINYLQLEKLSIVVIFFFSSPFDFTENKIIVFNIDQNVKAQMGRRRRRRSQTMIKTLYKKVKEMSLGDGWKKWKIGEILIKF
jgi:hypothetical protein